MEHLEKKLKALADKNRLRIIGLLAHRKFCVCEFAYVLKITQPSVSKHLKKLKEAGIIDSEQNGFWTNYFLTKKQSKDEQKILAAIVNNLLGAKQNKADIQASQKADRTKICDK